MNRTFFQQQIDRLADTYGSNHYKRERIEVMWAEMKDFSDHWFKKTVDKLIGEFAHAPLMPQFRLEMSFERERNAQSWKDRERKETQEFLRDSFSNEDKREICEMIRKIGSATVSDGETKSYISVLNNAAQAAERK